MTSNTTSDSVGGHGGGIGGKIKGVAQTVNGLGENVRGTILGGVDTVFHKDSSANDAIAAKGRAQHAEGMARLNGGTAGKPDFANWEAKLDPAAKTGGASATGAGANYGAAPQGTHATAGGAPYSNNQQTGQGYNNTFAGQTDVGPSGPGAGTAGGDPYLNSVNQQANQNPHTGAQDPYNPYHDHTAVAQNIPAYDGPGNAQQHLTRGDRPADEPRHHRDDALSGAPNLAPAALNVGQNDRGVPPKYTTLTGGPPADVGGQFRDEEVM